MTLRWEGGLVGAATGPVAVVEMTLSPEVSKGVLSWWEGRREGEG